MLSRGPSTASRVLLGAFALIGASFFAICQPNRVDDSFEGLKELHRAGHDKLHAALDPVVDPVVGALKSLDDSHAALAPETTAHEVFEENKDEVAEAIAEIPGEIADVVHDVEDAVEEFEEEAHEGFEPEESAHDVAVEIEENVEEAIPDIGEAPTPEAPEAPEAPAPA